jgi:hypothetical protein
VACERSGPSAQSRPDTSRQRRLPRRTLRACKPARSQWVVASLPHCQVRSAVEVVGAIVGTVGPRARGALGTVAARRVTAADRPPDGQARTLDTGLCIADGGVQQRPPQRAARSLTAAEREEISRGVAAGDSSRAIASWLGRAPSTVSRELARNGGRRRLAGSLAPATSARCD